MTPLKIGRNDFNAWSIADIAPAKWNGDGQNTDPQSMDYPNGLPKWTTLKWTTSKNTISEYILALHDLHGLQPPF